MREELQYILDALDVIVVVLIRHRGILGFFMIFSHHFVCTYYILYIYDDARVSSLSLI